jgi:NRPS condensation-like uncharacterized protein
MKNKIVSVSQSIPMRFATAMFDEFAFPNPGHDYQIRCVIRFDRKIDYDRLLKAIRLSFDAEPVLGCRFVDQWRGYYWERANDLDRMALCTVIESSNIDRDIEAFLLSPVDPRKDLPLQARLFRQNEDTLCIKINHMVSDAGGFKDYVYMLAKIYKRLADNLAYVPDKNISGDRSFKQVRKNFNLPDKIKIIRRGFRNWKSDSFPRKSWTFPLVSGDNSDRMILVRRFGPERFHVLKQFSRKHNATIHEIVTAAAIRTLAKIIVPSRGTPLRVGTTADLRRYIPGGKGDAICNLSTFFLLNIGCELGSSYEKTLTKVRNTLTRLKADYLGLGFYYCMMMNLKDILPSTWARWLCDRFLLFHKILNYGNVCPRLTNFGRIDNAQLDFGDVFVSDIFLIAPITYPPIFMPSISGYSETLTMSIGFANATENRKIIELFLDGVSDELPK